MIADGQVVRVVSVAEARTLGGLRLVVQRTVPNPWSEAAKSIMFVKRIPHVRVERTSRFAGIAGANADLEAWTGRDSAPIAVYENELPRDHWARILHLAERLQPEPVLIPQSADDRALLFGLAHEICDEDGFGWNRRLILLRGGSPQSLPAPPGQRDTGNPVADLELKYGAGGDLDQAYRRISEILGLLARRLHRQQADGSPYFIGQSLSAVDIYWATFSMLVRPLDQDRCPLEPHVRELYTLRRDDILKVLDPILLEHRDRIYERYLELPVLV